MDFGLCGKSASCLAFLCCKSWRIRMVCARRMQWRQKNLSGHGLLMLVVKTQILFQLMPLNYFVKTGIQLPQEKLQVVGWIFLITWLPVLPLWTRYGEMQNHLQRKERKECCFKSFMWILRKTINQVTGVSNLALKLSSTSDLDILVLHFPG